MKVITSSLIVAVLFFGKKEVWTSILSLGDERFQFQDELLIEKIPFAGSITTYLEGKSLSTGQLHCTFAVFKNFAEWEKKIKKLKCKGLQIVGLSSKHHADHWKMTINEKDDATHARIVLERLDTKAIPQLEYLIVACCLSQKNVKSDDPAVLRLIALPVFHYLFDPENITNKERDYGRPHLVEIAPCPCDLTKNNCDTFCCCDPDCPALFLDSFHCISGWFGGQRFQPLEDKSCYSIAKKPEHEDSVACIYIANSAFLGYFYPDIPKIEDEALFPSIASDEKEVLIKNYINKHEKAVHSNVHPRHHRQNVTKPIYHYGEKLQVIYNHTGVSKSADWLIPVSLYDGSCTLTYPLHFLINLHSICSMQLEKICKQDSPLNTLLDSKTFVTEDLVLLQAPGSSVPAQTIVTYLCVKSIAMYVKYDELNTSLLSEIVPCLQPVQPPSPKYQDGICYDVVLEVKYNLLWKNGNILLRNITIVLGDIPIINGEQFWNGSTTHLLTQHFSVEFNYLMNITSIPVGENASISEKFPNPETDMRLRSGNPGYDIGLPIISAVKDINDTISAAAVGNHLKLWNSDTTGKCGLARRRPVLFGINSISGCSMEIKTNDTCENVKSMLLDRLNDLMPAEYLSKGGYPDIRNLDDFVPLFREDVEPSDSESNETGDLSTCRDLPHHIHLEIAYSEVGRINYTDIRKIIGAVIRYKTVPTAPQCTAYDSPCESVNYPLTSSVHFIRVSLTKKRVKRYWDQGEVQYCNREICWGEMSYPFTDAFTADTVYEVFMWSSTLLLAAPLIVIVFKSI